MDKPPQKNFTTRELLERFDNIQGQLNRYVKSTNKRLHDLERTAEGRGERLEAFNETVSLLRDHLHQLESGLLQEFRLSQSIMKSMIEHDLSIEKARVEFEQKLQEQQRQQELENKKAREEMKRQLYMRLGTIGAPLLIAATALITRWIDSINL